MQGIMIITLLQILIVEVLGSRRKVLELGIETGLLAEKLIEMGLDISGFDFSTSMLEIAVKRLGRI